MNYNDRGLFTLVTFMITHYTEMIGSTIHWLLYATGTCFLATLLKHRASGLLRRLKAHAVDKT